MTNPIIHSPARWPQHALGAWRLVRTLHDDIEDLRAGLRAALDLLADRDRRIRSFERMNVQLQAQVRAAMTGRTIASERQALERERLDADTDARFEHRHQQGVA